MSKRHAATRDVKRTRQGRTRTYRLFRYQLGWCIQAQAVPIPMDVVAAFDRVGTRFELLERAEISSANRMQFRHEAVKGNCFNRCNHDEVVSNGRGIDLVSTVMHPSLVARLGLQL